MRAVNSLLGLFLLLAVGCATRPGRSVPGVVIQSNRLGGWNEPRIPVTLVDRRTNIQKTGWIAAAEPKRRDKLQVAFAAENFDPSPLESVRREVGLRLAEWPRPVKSATVELRAFRVEVEHVNQELQTMADREEAARRERELKCREERRKSEAEDRRRQAEDRQRRREIAKARGLPTDDIDAEESAAQEIGGMILGGIFRGVFDVTKAGVSQQVEHAKEPRPQNYELPLSDRQNIVTELRLTVRVELADGSTDVFDADVLTSAQQLFDPTEGPGGGVTDAVNNAIRSIGHQVAEHGAPG
jgi:hypothetical protein